MTVAGCRAVSGEDHPRWALESRSLAPGGVHAETGALGQVRSPERAARASPMPLPVRRVALRQTPLVNCERLTWPAPLLQSTMSGGFGVSTAPAAATSVAMVSQIVLSLPVLVGV